jgi:hypothetical protein
MDRIGRYTSPPYHHMIGRPLLTPGRAVPSVGLTLGLMRRDRSVLEMKESGLPMFGRRFRESSWQKTSHPQREERHQVPLAVIQEVSALEVPPLLKGERWLCRTRPTMTRRWHPLPRPPRLPRQLCTLGQRQGRDAENGTPLAKSEDREGTGWPYYWAGWLK